MAKKKQELIFEKYFKISDEIEVVMKVLKSDLIVSFNTETYKRTEYTIALKDFNSSFNFYEKYCKVRQEKEFMDRDNTKIVTRVKTQEEVNIELLDWMWIIPKRYSYMPILEDIRTILKNKI